MFYIYFAEESSMKSYKAFLELAIDCDYSMLTYSSAKCIKYYCFDGPCCVKLLFLAFQCKRQVEKNREHQINFSVGIPASFLLCVHTFDFREKKRNLVGR